MKDRMKYVFNHLVKWYGVQENETEMNRIEKLLNRYEQDIPRMLKLDLSRPMEDIAKEVCQNNNLTYQQLRRDSPVAAYGKYKRKSDIFVKGRREFAIIARRNGWSFQQIADFLGYLHHTSVIALVYETKLLGRKRPLAEVIEIDKIPPHRFKGNYSNTSPMGIAKEVNV